jgi:hypothetical protein
VLKSFDIEGGAYVGGVGFAHVEFGHVSCAFCWSWNWECSPSVVLKTDLRAAWVLLCTSDVS